MISKNHKIIFFIIMTGLIICFPLDSINASQSYIPEDLYLISWGESTGQLSTSWNDDFSNAEGDFVEPPDCFAISESGDLVFSEWNRIDHRLTHFSSSGSFIAEAVDLFDPDEIAISANSIILISNMETLMLCDAEFNVLRTDIVPNAGDDTYISGLFPSNNHKFWILYYVDKIIEDVNIIDIYLVEYGFDGFSSTPMLIHSGESAEGYYFVTPEGVVKPNIEDIYGYKYEVDYEYDTDAGPTLYRFSPSNELYFQFTLASDPDWSVFDDAFSHYMITWSGDFYTIRATDAGAVVTKFRLNVDPICNLVQITDFLNPVIFPFPVEFDTSGTYDPNGDALTYEWDFDGDGIFDEPFDDIYGGSPNNPTHVYTDDFDGVVSVRVRDPYDGECYATSHLTIHD